MGGVDAGAGDCGRDPARGRRPRVPPPPPVGPGRARVDTTGPVLAAGAAGATVDGTELVLTYERAGGGAEHLDQDSVPAPGEFILSVEGTTHSVASVAVDAARVTLGLAAPVGHAQTVTVVDYNPGANPIRDLWGNPAPRIDFRSVRNDSPEPGLSIGDVTVTEDAGKAEFTVSLDVVSGEEVTVDYATSDGTATAGSDYTAVTDTLTLAPGDVAETVEVALVDDMVSEGSETFTVMLSTASNASIVDGEATATIDDDEGTPTLTVAEAFAAEGDAVEFTVTLAPASTGDVTVQYATADGTATAGTDYTAPADGAELTISAGETTGTISIATGDDDVYEEDETFTVMLANPSANAVVGAPGSAIGTITNDDEIAGTLVLNLDTIAGDDVVNIAEKATGFTISGDTGPEAGVSVSVQIGSTTLTATSAGAGTATWSVTVLANASYITGTSVEVTVSASKSGFAAPNDIVRTLTIDLTAPTVPTYTAPSSLQVGTAITTMSPSGGSGIDEFAAAGLPSGLRIDTGTGAITGTPDTADASTATATVTISDVAGNTATVSLTFPAVDKGDQTLTGFSYSPASLTFGSPAPSVTAPSGAVGALSYAATPSTVCTADPSSGALTIVGAGSCEITATAAGTAHYNEATATFTVTVQAGGVPALSFASSSIVVNEAAGPAVLTVMLDRASAGTVTVRYTTLGDTARVNEDYGATSGTLTFKPGETSKTIAVRIVDDANDEPDERFWFRLRNATGATLPSRPWAEVTITDDAPLPAASIADVTVGEGAGTMTLTLTLDRPSNADIAYVATQSDVRGTATEGADYAAFLPGGSRTLTVPAGSLSGSFDIAIVDDGVAEPDETIVITWKRHPGSAATPRSIRFTGTITDDDTANTPATGKPSISGVAEVGQTLSAEIGTLADPDGLPATYPDDYDFQWVRVDADGASNPAPVAGATGATYRPTATDVGKRLMVRVSFTDGGGASEGPLSSDAWPSSGTIAAPGLLPALSFASSSIVVNEAAGPAVLTVKLDRASAGTVTVRYTTLGDTARVNEDYGATSGTLTFKPGETSKTIAVRIVDDANDEPDERFWFRLRNASGATLPSRPWAEVTITDGEVLPAASIADVTVGEGAGTMTLTLTLDRPSNADIAYVATQSDVSGTATEGADYAAFVPGGSRTLTVPAGSLSGSFDIAIVDDGVAEPDETIVIAWKRHPASAATPGSILFTGTITDDDTANTPATGKPSISGVAEVGQTLSAEIGTLADPDGLPATYPDDYDFQWVRVDADGASNPAPVAGATGATYRPTATDVGKRLMVRVSFTDGGGASEGPFASDAWPSSGTIAAPGVLPAMSFASDAIVVNETSGPAVFTVKLDRASPGTVTVDYSTFADTASANKDYRATSGTLTFTPGETSKTIEVPILVDAEDEPDERFRVTLRNVSGATLPSRPSAEVTITSDAALPAASIADVTVGEGAGTMTLTLTLDRKSNGDIAYVATQSDVSGTATEDADYAAFLPGGSRTLTVPAGSLSGSFDIAIVDDGVAEPDETIVITWKRHRGSAATPRSIRFTGTITDDDTANTPATGKPSISGVAEVGQTLSAEIGTLADPDGLPATYPDDYAFQWVRVDADGVSNPAPVAGATGATYTPTATDVGKRLRVEVSFTDGGGASEGPLGSDATADAVVAAEGACLADAEWCTTLTVGRLGSSDLSALGETWDEFFGIYAQSTVLAGSLGGDTIDGPRAYRVGRLGYGEKAGSKEVLVHLFEDEFLPRGSVFDLGGVEFTADAASEEDVKGQYSWSAPGGFAWIEGQKVKVGVNLAPALVTATADGMDLVLTYHEDLDDTSVPAANAYAVEVDGRTGVTPSSVAIAGKTVTLTLATAVTSGQTVTVSYAPPGANPLQDASGLDAPGFTDQAVTNNTGATNTPATGKPSISGVAEVAQSLTAEIGTLADPDGLPATYPDDYAFQWVRVDADGVSNPDPIAGATGATYAPTAADVGKRLMVRVSFTDGGGASEGPLASDAWPSSGTIAAPGLPVLSFASDAIEVNETAGPAVLTVKLDRASAGTVTVRYTTLGDSARVNEDYRANSGTLTFTPGETSKTIEVSILEDAEDEPDERFWVRLRNATGATLVSRPWVEVNITDRGAGPPGLSVADAEVEEGPNAVLAFVVTLDREAPSTVTVDYATADGTATEDEDYTAASGTLTFLVGETEKTVSVAVLDDSHDEGNETLTLALSNPSGAYLADGVATGTITNTDLIPQEWLGRFGRTVADQVLDAMESRMTESRVAGAALTIAGQRVGGGAAPGVGVLETRAADAGLEPHTLTGRDLLTGSSFALTGGTAEDGFGAVWGRGAVTRFDGRDGELSLDGEVTSALVGADITRGRGAAGLVLSHSLGEGDYRSPDGPGEVESTLTGLYPWGRYAVSERLSVWGGVGFGSGTLALAPESQTRIETDLHLAMGAVGGRGVLVKAPAEGGLELGVTSDVLLVRTSSDAVSEDRMSLAASEADVARLRLGLEGTWRELEVGGAAFVPTLEFGMRHDGGDAERGFGADIGTKLAWTDPSRGIAAEIAARGLLTHEEDGFRERGIAAALAWDPDPSTERGPSLTVRQAVGAEAPGGMDALLGPEGARVLEAADGDGDERERRALDAKLGYGLPLFGGRYTGTPSLGLSLTDTHREAKLGWRLAEARRAGLVFDLGVEGARRERAAGDGGPEHQLGLGFGWRLEGADAERFELRFEGARVDAANDAASPELRVGVKLEARW